MQHLEVKKVFEAYDSSANAKTEYEHIVKRCNLDIWQHILERVSTEKAKKIFNEYDISNYKSLGMAIKAEMQKDKLFEAQYHGFSTVAEFEKYDEDLRAEVERLIGQLGERYG